MEVNEFADLTEEEFNAQYLNKVKVPSKRTLTQVQHRVMGAVPNEVDWNKAGKVSQPGAQDSCGSCWAWSAATVLESLYAIRKNTSPPKYSVQYLVDCDRKNYGCGGGWMYDAFEFTKNYGIVKWSDYPGYANGKRECRDR